MPVVRWLLQRRRFREMGFTSSARLLLPVFRSDGCIIDCWKVPSGPPILPVFYIERAIHKECPYGGKEGGPNLDLHGWHPTSRTSSASVSVIVSAAAAVFLPQHHLSSPLPD